MDVTGTYAMRRAVRRRMRNAAIRLTASWMLTGVVIWFLYADAGSYAWRLAALKVVALGIGTAAGTVMAMGDRRRLPARKDAGTALAVGATMALAGLAWGFASTAGNYEHPRAGAAWIFTMMGWGMCIGGTIGLIATARKPAG